MKKLYKSVLAIGAAVLIAGTTQMAFAASDIKTPLESVSNITGKKVEDVQKEKESGKSYGQIANESGKLEEFKKERLDNKKAMLDSLVSEGKITKEKSDEIIKNMKERQESCNGDGSGCQRSGQGKGMGMGQGKGNCYNIK